MLGDMMSLEEFVRENKILILFLLLGILGFIGWAIQSGYFEQSQQTTLKEVEPLSGSGGVAP